MLPVTSDLPSGTDKKNTSLFLCLILTLFGKCPLVPLLVSLQWFVVLLEPEVGRINLDSGHFFFVPSPWLFEQPRPQQELWYLG